MRKLLIFLLAFMIVGAASGLPMFGPAQGFRNPGNIEVGGTLSIGGANIVAGTVTYDDITQAAYVNETAINATIAALNQSSYVNETAINTSVSTLTIGAYTNETAINATLTAMPGSIINTAYGLKNLSGDAIVNLTANDGLEFGTGATLGALGVKTGDGLDTGATGVLVDATDIINTANGLYESTENNIAINLTEDGGLGFGTGADSGALIVYPYYGLKNTANGLEVNLTANKGLEFGTGAALNSLQIKLDGSTLALGASGIKVTDNTFAGKLAAYLNETAINSSKTANKQSDYINQTAINTTLSKMLYGSGAINASTSISTVLTNSSTKTVFPVDASGGHVTLTLPDAATNAGRVYMVVLAADMGGNNVIVDTTGAANLGGTSGPDSLTSTDADAALTAISDGTNYLIINKDGTWS